MLINHDLKVHVNFTGVTFHSSPFLGFQSGSQLLCVLDWVILLMEEIRVNQLIGMLSHYLRWVLAPSHVGGLGISEPSRVAMRVCTTIFPCVSRPGMKLVTRGLLFEHLKFVENKLLWFIYIRRTPRKTKMTGWKSTMNESMCFLLKMVDFPMSC